MFVWPFTDPLETREAGQTRSTQSQTTPSFRSPPGKRPSRSSGDMTEHLAESGFTEIAKDLEKGDAGRVAPDHVARHCDGCKAESKELSMFATSFGAEVVAAPSVDRRFNHKLCRGWVPSRVTFSLATAGRATSTGQH